jgi:hypothetical protein
MVWSLSQSYPKFGGFFGLCISRQETGRGGHFIEPLLFSLIRDDKSAKIPQKCAQRRVYQDSLWLQSHTPTSSNSDVGGSRNVRPKTVGRTSCISEDWDDIAASGRPANQPIAGCNMSTMFHSVQPNRKHPHHHRQTLADSCTYLHF